VKASVAFMMVCDWPKMQVVALEDFETFMFEEKD